MGWAEIAQIWVCIGAVLAMWLIYAGPRCRPTAQRMSWPAFAVGMALWAIVWPFAVAYAAWQTYKGRRA